MARFNARPVGFDSSIIMPTRRSGITHNGMRQLSIRSSSSLQLSPLLALHRSCKLICHVTARRPISCFPILNTFAKYNKSSHFSNAFVFIGKFHKGLKLSSTISIDLRDSTSNLTRPESFFQRVKIISFISLSRKS